MEDANQRALSRSHNRSWNAMHQMSLVFGLIVMTVFAPVMSSQASEDPVRFIEQLGHDAIDILSEESSTPADRDQVFRSLLIRYFDMKKIGRLVMGRYWRRADEPQKAEFFELFEDFVVTTYARRLNGYSGEQFDVGAARQNGQKTTAVASRITQPNGMPIRIDWILQQDGGRWYVVDIVIEGISMVITQRSEFGAVISQRGGIEGLLESLRLKAKTEPRS